jgi:hypothetical protein
MSTQFYDEMEKLATELMNEFGTPATLRQVTKSKPGADGKAVLTFDDNPGLAVQIKDEELVRALELTGDVAYATKFPARGNPGHQLIHASLTYEIKSAKHVSPEGTRLMVSFFGVSRA